MIRGPPVVPLASGILPLRLARVQCHVIEEGWNEGG